MANKSLILRKSAETVLLLVWRVFSVKTSISVNVRASSSKTGSSPVKKWHSSFQFCEFGQKEIHLDERITAGIFALSKGFARIADGVREGGKVSTQQTVTVARATVIVNIYERKVQQMISTPSTSTARTRPNSRNQLCRSIIIHQRNGPPLGSVWTDFIGNEFGPWDSTEQHPVAAVRNQYGQVEVLTAGASPTMQIIKFPAHSSSP
ncbi:hypothetical protein C8R43DRAFT_942292 [Mycena crocata]|nr:hypothetical protein C8R43DRAFT_942292 [Mycena crocata]